MNTQKPKHSVDITKLTVKELRNRLFNKRSEALLGSPYTFNDDVPEQIERLEGFTNWETFFEEWDVLWVGLDPRHLKWVAGRHNSPKRVLVLPIRLVEKDERTNRMMETFIDKADIKKIEVPFKKPLPETEEDRAISDSLTGKVVVDEPDKDKAIRLIQENMALLQNQLAALGVK